MGLLPAGEAKRQDVKAKALPPAKPRGMNKLEQRMHERLSAMLASGAIAWFGYECLTFKLAGDCRFTPDFIVINLDGSIEAIETKGFFRDDAKVKTKVAARQFPWLTFSVWKWGHGAWVTEVIKT